MYMSQTYFKSVISSAIRLEDVSCQTSDGDLLERMYKVANVNDVTFK